MGSGVAGEGLVEGTRARLQGGMRLAERTAGRRPESSRPAGCRLA